MGASALRSRAIAVPYGLARRHGLAGKCPAALFDALMSTSRLPFRSVICSCPSPSVLPKSRVPDRARCRKPGYRYLNFREQSFSATRCIAYDVCYDTSKKEGFKGLAEPSEVGTMPLRGLSALLFLGGIVYALLSGIWGIGAIAFGLGAVVLGLDRLRAQQSRSERSIGWVLVLCGALTVVFIAMRMALGVT
jgi:hypothetical protein